MSALFSGYSPSTFQLLCLMKDDTKFNLPIFRPNLVDLLSDNPIKNQYSIPPEMQSCHTSIIGKYFVEGHVPMEAIQKLLAEQPDIDGALVGGASLKPSFVQLVEGARP